MHVSTHTRATFVQVCKKFQQVTKDQQQFQKLTGVLM